MAWLKDRSGLPPFQQQPPAAGRPAAAARAGSLSSQASQEGPAGLLHAYSTDTQRSTEEEEELSRELTMELLADLECSGRYRQQRGSGPPSQQASEGGAAAAGGGGDAAAGGAEDDARAGCSVEGEVEEELQPSLYDQLGGGVVVKGVVDSFYARVLGDPELGRFFEGVDMAKHTRKFLLFVTYVLGGPDEYLQVRPEPWPALYQVHEQMIQRLGLSEVHFDLVKQHFADALAGGGASQRLIDMALSVVETTRRIMFPLVPPGQQAAQQAAGEQPAPATAARQAARQEGAEAARRSAEAARAAAKVGAAFPPSEFEFDI